MTYIVALLIAIVVALGTIAGTDLLGVTPNAAVAVVVGTVAGALWVVARRQARGER